MDLISVSLWYGQVCVLLGLSYLLVRLFGFFTVNARAQLRWSGCALALSVLAPSVLALAPSPSLWEPTAQIWTGTSMKQIPNPAAPKSPSLAGAASAPANLPHSTTAVGLVLLLTACYLLRFFRGIWQTHRFLKSTFPFKRIGRVQVRLTDRPIGAFSFHSLKTAFIVIPVDLMARSEGLLLTVRHESQHHRQRDTLHAYAIELFRVVFAVNPFSHLWASYLHECQEFACDRQLVGHPAVSVQAYGGCLLEAARQSLSYRSRLVGTTGMASGNSAAFLKRRILMITSSKKEARPLMAAFLGTNVLLTVLFGALAVGSGVQDRRIQRDQAERLAATAARKTAFPIVVNDMVLAELNRYLGTPDGRQYMRDALERMQQYSEMLDRKIAQYKMPRELLAIPVMESGYRNLAEHHNPVRAAGLWQFIRSTARHYNLKVNGSVDERLDTEKETDAAMRYLAALHLRFQHWHLAVLGYNAGENKVQQGINELQSRDAWELIQNGYSGDAPYLSRVMAAIIIMLNPETLD